MSPSQLTPAIYLDHIRAESARFADVLSAAAPDAQVPTCPDWTASELFWHLTEVQDFWGWVVTNRPAAPEDGYKDPERPSTHNGIARRFDDASTAFIKALEAADPGDESWCWSTDPAHHFVSFSFRRQAHEALIHRLDAELAAGVPHSPIDPQLAADGVEECLNVMYGGLPPWGTFEPRPVYAEFVLTDVDRSVWTQFGTFSGTTPDGEVRADEADMHVVPEPGVPAAVRVSGTAAALDAWLWHRADDAQISISGDDDALAHIRDVLGHAIN